MATTPIDVTTLTDEQLSTLIGNHRVKNATAAPLYVEAVAEQHKRGSLGLDLETTVKALAQAARQRRFMSYKDVADANGATWNKVRFRMNKHLDDVLYYCHQTKLPFLTAIVVPKPNIKTGKQDAETLKGFVAGIERLGVAVTMEEDFMDQEQKRVFDWGGKQTEAERA